MDIREPNDKPIKEWVKKHSLIIILLTSVAVTGIAWVLNWVDSASASGILSALLVIVTGYYATKVSESIDEVRKDRKKRGIILLIAYTIDPLIERFEEDRDRYRDFDYPPIRALTIDIQGHLSEVKMRGEIREYSNIIG
jgi:hypothetical protein